MPPTNGIYLETRIDETLTRNLVSRHPLLSSGARIADHLRQKTEIVFLEFESEDDMRRNLVSLPRNIEAMMQTAT